MVRAFRLGTLYPGEELSGEYLVVFLLSSWVLFQSARRRLPLLHRREVV